MHICRQIGVNLFTRKRVEVAADCGTIESNFESIRNEFEELGESLSSSPQEEEETEGERREAKEVASCFFSRIKRSQRRRGRRCVLHK